jgi:hypothetical protein
MRLIMVLAEDENFSRFQKTTESIVDGLVEKLIALEEGHSEDSSVRNVIQSLSVFCFGRYHVLAPHLSLLLHYVFDSRTTQSAISASELVSKVASSASSCLLRQYPQFLEKSSKLFIQCPERMVEHLLYCLFVYDERELHKLASKFKGFLAQKAHKKTSNSALQRALLIIGLCGKLLDSNYCRGTLDFLETLEMDIALWGPAYCLCVTKCVDMIDESFKACLSSANDKLRLNALIAFREALNQFSLADLKASNGVSFDSKACNSVSADLRAVDNLLKGFLVTALEAGTLASPEFLSIGLDILQSVMGIGLVSPNVYIPHIVAAGILGHPKGLQLLSECFDKYSYLMSASYAQGLHLAFENSLNEGLDGKGLDLLMHLKGCWKDVVKASFASISRSKESSFTTWCLNCLMSAGLSCQAEHEFIKKHLHNNILHLADIYYDEVESSEDPDPIIVYRLAFFLDAQKIYDSLDLAALTVGRKIRSGIKLTIDERLPTDLSYEKCLDIIESLCEIPSSLHDEDELFTAPQMKKRRVLKHHTHADIRVGRKPKCLRLADGIVDDEPHDSSSGSQNDFD